MNGLRYHDFLKGVIIIFGLGIIVLLIYLSTGNLSSRETGLLSTMLTILSVIAAWIISHFYSAATNQQAIDEVKQGHQENLQTYALKAAEKVNNLSDQLNKLAMYLKNEIENSEYDTVEETLRAREERLSSAIHMIAMLKSVNDTGLSDWQGVIGDQLEEQREERFEQEEKLNEMIFRLEKLWLSSPAGDVLDQHIEAQLKSLNTDVRTLIAAVGGIPVKLQKPRKKVKREVVQSCFECGAEIEYRQRAKTNSMKALDCASCGAKFISRYSKEHDDFIIEEHNSIIEDFKCPSCNEPGSVELDVFPGSISPYECNGCSQPMKVVRKQNGDIKVSPAAAAKIKLTEELLQQVQELLPDQPWPKDTHKAIAKKLGCSNGLVG